MVRSGRDGFPALQLVGRACFSSLSTRTHVNTPNSIVPPHIWSSTVRFPSTALSLHSHGWVSRFVIYAALSNTLLLTVLVSVRHPRSHTAIKGVDGESR